MGKRTKLEVRYRRPKQEAVQLWQRAQRASPAERAQIEQRAAQFLQQQQAKLQADNAKAMAELARLRQAAGPARGPPSLRGLSRRLPSFSSAPRPPSGPRSSSGPVNS